MLIERSLDITFFLVFEGFLIFSLFLFRSDRSDALSIFQVLYAFYHDFIAGLQAACNVKIFAIIQAEYLYFGIFSACCQVVQRIRISCPVFLWWPIEES